MKVTAIVLAGGRGNRMKSDVPKQYINVCGHPVIYYTLKAFEESSVDDVVLVTGAGDEKFCREEIVKSGGILKVRNIVAGGSERYLSVYNGLCGCEDSDIIMVHDGARCLIEPELIDRLVSEVKEKRGVIAAVPVKDTIKVVDDSLCVSDTPRRNSLWSVQTPQAFYYNDLKSAYERMFELYGGKKAGLPVTDDSMVMEQFSHMNIHVVMGNYTNIKVTTPDDIEIVKNVIKKREELLSSLI